VSFYGQKYGGWEGRATFRVMHILAKKNEKREARRGQNVPFIIGKK
jgi:hypothetical protein